MPPFKQLRATCERFHQKSTFNRKLPVAEILSLWRSGKPRCIANTLRSICYPCNQCVPYWLRVRTLPLRLSPHMTPPNVCVTHSLQAYRSMGASRNFFFRNSNNQFWRGFVFRKLWNPSEAYFLPSDWALSQEFLFCHFLFAQILIKKTCLSISGKDKSRIFFNKISMIVRRNERGAWTQKFSRFLQISNCKFKVRNIRLAYRQVL